MTLLLNVNNWIKFIALHFCVLHNSFPFSNSALLAHTHTFVCSHTHSYNQLPSFLFHLLAFLIFLCKNFSLFCLFFLSPIASAAALNEQSTDAYWMVWNNTKEICYTTCIRIASFDVISLPCDCPCDLAWDVVTNDIFTLNFR